jgi:hypothetical protein
MRKLRPAVLNLVLALVPIAGLMCFATSSHDVQLRAEKIDPMPPARTIAQIAGDRRLVTGDGQTFPVFQLRQGAPTETPYRFLIEGGLHGDEAVGSVFATWVAKRFARGVSMLNQLPKGTELDILPHANPDGAQLNTRLNGRGVNLNRNFGVLWGVSRENPGNGSFSEPETRAIRALFNARRYTAAVDVHGYVNWVVTPSTPEMVAAHGIKAPASRAAAHTQWVNAVRTQMALLPNYQFKSAGGLGDGGAFEDWAFWSQGTFAYCLELESFERYQRSYRPDFADITHYDETRSVDQFLRYEAFVYRTFAAAIHIIESKTPAHLAADH